MSLAVRLPRFRLAAILSSLALLVGVCAPAKAAAEPVDVAARIAAMNTVASNITAAIAERQTRAINRMTELDTQGKADRVILGAAQAGKRAVGEARERGIREVRKIATRTLQQLTRQGASAEVKAQVEAARDAALTTINNAALAAREAIGVKADELTGAGG